MRRLESIAAVVLSFAATYPCSGAATSDAAVAEGLTRIVKLYGAGGFRGLEAYGSGFLASADGHVVTSWGPLLDAEPVVAVLDDGRRADAKLVGVDPGSGLAVLKIEGFGGAVPHFDLADAAEAEPGDRIFALSNMFRVAAGDEPVSVMHGVVLAKTPLAARRGRFEVTFDGPVYVIDAVTNNPGAAGGVVVTRDGRLVGMIGRELRGEGTETWVNYAIPAETIRERFEAIVSGNVVAADEPGGEIGDGLRPVDLGIVTVPDVTARTPAYVTDILAGSAAESAGVRRDDLILFADRRPVRSIRELAAAVAKAEAGDQIEIVVRREGRLASLRVVVP